MPDIGPDIAILLRNARGGGAERAQIVLAEAFLRAGRSVEFVLMQREGELLPLIPQGASVHALECARFRSVLPKYLAYLRTRRPKAVLATMWPMTGIAAFAKRLSGRPPRLVVSEQNDLRFAPAIGPLERRLLKRVGHWIYQAADRVVAVSQGVADSIRAVARVAPDHIQVIHNPITAPHGAALDAADHALIQWWTGGEGAILAVGAFKPQKGFDDLLRAISLAAATLRLRLVILGDGALRPELEALVAELGLSDQVRLPGFRVAPRAFFESADLFALSSRWEGLATVIVEALSCGLPVVSTDCPSGAREILADGRFGSLVPVGAPVQLADAILRNLSATHDRDALCARAADFSSDAAASAYLSLLCP